MIQNLFPTQIWKVSLNVEQSIGDEILCAIEEDLKKNNLQNYSPWNCKVHTNFSNSSNIDYSKIIPYFKDEYEKFSRQINLKSHEYEIHKLWYNYYLNGCNQEYHDHVSPVQSIAYSMVYYLKINDKHPTITFHNYTNFYAFYNSDLKIKNIYPEKDINHSITNPFWNLDIKQGDLIIFPSYLPHGVFAQKTNDPRITVSSNILLL